MTGLAVTRDLKWWCRCIDLVQLSQMAEVDMLEVSLVCGVYEV